MKEFKKIKIITLCFIAIITPLYTNLFTLIDLASSISENNNGSLEKLKNSDYTSIFDGNGEDINLSLQQSLLDNSVIERNSNRLIVWGTFEIWKYSKNGEEK